MHRGSYGMAPMDTHLRTLCQRLPELQDVAADIQTAAACCIAAFRAGGTLYLCGNGGSFSDAEHIAGELMKGFLRRRPLPAAEQELLRADHGDDGILLARALQGGLRAVVLGAERSLSTAVGNDNDPALIFAQPLYALSRPGDVLLGLSTSGNARNVALACQVARCRGLRTIGLTGRSGGRLRQLSDLCIRVPADETYRVQELHVAVYHCLCAMLEEAFFSE